MKRTAARLYAAWVLARAVGDSPAAWLWYWVLRMDQ